ncbi:9977_t:CDS:1, partial [Funneliformis geosporum]
MSKVLQDVYNDLALEAMIFFNGLKSDKEMTDFLKKILATKKKS